MGQVAYVCRGRACRGHWLESCEYGAAWTAQSWAVCVCVGGGGGGGGELQVSE